MIQRIGIWYLRITIGLSIVFLALIAVFGFMLTRTYNNWANCLNDPLPSIEQAQRVAEKALQTAARGVGIPADRFDLHWRIGSVNKSDPPPYPAEWDFYYRVKGGVARPKQIQVVVNRCLRAHAVLDYLD